MTETEGEVRLTQFGVSDDQTVDSTRLALPFTFLPLSSIHDTRDLIREEFLEAFGQFPFLDGCQILHCVGCRRKSVDGLKFQPGAADERPICRSFSCVPGVLD